MHTVTTLLARRAPLLASVAWFLMGGVAKPADATAVFNECASDRSYLCLIARACQTFETSSGLHVPDWQAGVKAAAIDGYVSAKAIANTQR